MKPGPDFDKWIAEHVMGWKQGSRGSWYMPGLMVLELPEFSTEIRSAMEVWQKTWPNTCCKLLWVMDMGDWVWQFQVNADPGIITQSDLPSHAICLAARELIEKRQKAYGELPW